MFRRTRSRNFAAVLAAATCLTTLSCTSDWVDLAQPTAPPADPLASGARTRSTFATIDSNDSTGNSQLVRGLAAKGTTTVAVGSTSGYRNSPAFWYSADQGATWRTGTVASGSADSVALNESVFEVVDAPHGWLALGAAAGVAVTVWTSQDGQDWTRRALPTAVFDQFDSIADLVRTSTGFLAVGTREIPDKAAMPVVWTSKDGQTWTRTTATDYGFGVGKGKFLQAAATDGTSTMVAVGSERESKRPVLWRSTTADTSWTEIHIDTDPLNDGSGVSFSDVVRTPGGFAVLGTASPNGTYLPVVYRGGNGGDAWEPDLSSRQMGSGTTPVYGQALGVIGDEVAVFCSVQSRRSTVRAALSTNWSAPVDLPKPPAAATSIDVSDTVTTGGVVLVSATTQVDGVTTSSIWRSEDGSSYSAVEVPDQRDSSPVVSPTSAAIFKGSLYATGDSQATSALWKSPMPVTGTTTFSAPTTIAKGAENIWDVRSGPKHLLLLGDYTASSSSAGRTWVSSDGATFIASAPDSFGTPGPFAYSSLNDAVWFKGRWVVVGSGSTDGWPNIGAIAFWSTDGVNWTKAKPATVSTPATEDHGEVNDLTGAEYDNRAMTTVTGTDNGLIAGGYVTSGNEYVEPAIWSSPDGGTWTLRLLPLPANTAAGRVVSVAAHGKVVTAVGGTFNNTDPTVEAQSQVWRSADGGATWTGQALRTVSNAVTVTYAGSGFVNGRFFVIGTLAKGDERQATMWTSSDGFSWKAQPLTDPLLRGPGRRTPMATVVQGDTVIGIAQIVTLGYAGPILFTQG